MLPLKVVMFRLDPSGCGGCCPLPLLLVEVVALAALLGGDDCPSHRSHRSNRSHRQGQQQQPRPPPHGAKPTTTISEGNKDNYHHNLKEQGEAPPQTTTGAKENLTTTKGSKGRHHHHNRQRRVWWQPSPPPVLALPWRGKGRERGGGVMLTATHSVFEHHLEAGKFGKMNFQQSLKQC